MEIETIRVAVAQAAPVYLDREATLEKAVRLVGAASASGARLIAFPEGFLPGHPLWYHFYPVMASASRDLATRLLNNSVAVPSSQVDVLARAARAHHIHIMMGMCERSSEHSGTMYNSQLLIGPQGQILNHHRKLTPTVGERLVHAPGDASGLRVVPTEIGRLSGLICGENSNPLELFALIAENTQIHVMAWPAAASRARLARADRALITGRSFAFMSKAYVLNANAVLDDGARDVLAANAEDRQFLDDPSITGGSSVIGPNGRIIAGPLDHTEQLLFADLDLSQVAHEKHTHDYAGHYNRSDIFSLSVDRTRREIYRPYAGSESTDLAMAYAAESLGEIDVRPVPDTVCDTPHSARVLDVALGERAPS